MENNSDRMGFALIALSVVAFVLLAVNGPLKSTVNGFFNGFKDWQTQTFDGISETNKPDVTHTAYSWSSDGTDGFYVGSGRNLLNNTDNDISVTSHTTDGYPAWAHNDTGFSFEHGKTYTFSAEAKNSTDKITEASIRVFEESTNTQVGIYAFPADGKRHSVTFTIPNDSHDYHLLLYAGHAGIDPGVDITTTYHDQKLEEVYVGGVSNLAHRTSSDWTKVSVQSDDWGIRYLCDPIYTIVNGETYTVQVEVRNMTAPVMLEPFAFNSDNIRDGVLAQVPKTDKDGKISITFTANLPDGYAYFMPDLAFTMPTTGAGSYEFRQFKVEKGTIATPYSPASSDVQPKYIGTYTDKNESASQDPSKYTWKLNPDYHE